MPSVLLAGPCISEFGWEIMEWQGHVRALANKFDHVVVCSTNSHYALYQDYNPIFVGHHVKGIRDCHTMRKIDNQQEWDRVVRIMQDYERSFKASGYDVVWANSKPPHGGAVGARRPIEKQVFVKFGRPSSTGFDVIVHARNRPFKYAYEGHNYPIAQWNQLVHLLKECGYTDIAAIGTSEQALVPEGAVDCRDAKLEDVMDMMASARVVIGPSSGPMHLASLCHAPHVVWARSRQQSAINKRNKERYESYWNPLNTPTRVILHNDKEPPVAPTRIAAAVKSLDHKYSDNPVPKQSLAKAAAAQKPKVTSGVVYVAVGPKYVQGAAISISTLRRVFSGPVMLLSDRPSEQLDALKDSFGVDIRIHDTGTKDAHKSSRVLKTQVMKLCPYDYGMFIDADTLVLGPVHNVWGVLGDANIALAISQHYPHIGDAGKAKEHMKHRAYSDDFRATKEVTGASFPHYHSSTIVWRRSQETTELANKWYAEWQAFKCCDMFPLARAMSKIKPTVAKLPRKYNLRFHMNGDTVIYTARLEDIRKVYKRLFPPPNISRVREMAKKTRPAMQPVSKVQLKRIVRSLPSAVTKRTKPAKARKSKSLRELLSERKKQVRVR